MKGVFILSFDGDIAHNRSSDLADDASRLGPKVFVNVCFVWFIVSIFDFLIISSR